MGGPGAERLWQWFLEESFSREGLGVTFFPFGFLGCLFWVWFKVYPFLAYVFPWFGYKPVKIDLPHILGIFIGDRIKMVAGSRFGPLTSLCIEFLASPHSLIGANISWQGMCVVSKGSLLPALGLRSVSSEWSSFHCSDTPGGWGQPDPPWSPVVAAHGCPS